MTQEMIDYMIGYDTPCACGRPGIIGWARHDRRTGRPRHEYECRACWHARHAASL